MLEGTAFRLHDEIEATGGLVLGIFGGPVVIPFTYWLLHTVDDSGVRASLTAIATIIVGLLAVEIVGTYSVVVTPIAAALLAATFARTAPRPPAADGVT